MPSASSAPTLPFLERLLDGEKVEWKTLGEVGTFVRGTSFQKKHFVEKGVGCIHYGEIYTRYSLFAEKTISYLNEEIANKARKASYGDLIIATTSENDDDVCKSVAWLGSENIVVSNDACYYHHTLDPKYVAYFFRTDEFQRQKRNYITGTKVKRVNANDLAKITIPIPPLRVQSRIVEILDKFTQLEAQLEAELQAELEARRKQYAYYRDHVLISHNTPPLNVNVEWKTLGEVCDYIRGITYSKTAETTDSCGWKVLRANNITLETRTLNFDEVKRVKSATRIRENQMLYRGDILICAGSGSKDHIGKTAYIDHDMDCTFGGFMGVLRVTAENTVSSRFLFHYIGSSVFINYLKTTLKSSTINNLNAGIINPFPIPIPPLSEQRRIVDILDRFDTLTNSISEGLTKEIALRRKQYAYYRDALLSFPRPEVSA